MRHPPSVHVVYCSNARSSLEFETLCLAGTCDSARRSDSGTTRECIKLYHVKTHLCPSSTINPTPLLPFGGLASQLPCGEFWSCKGKTFITHGLLERPGSFLAPGKSVLHSFLVGGAVLDSHPISWRPFVMRLSIPAVSGNKQHINPSIHVMDTVTP